MEEEIILPETLAGSLMEILVADEKAKLLLRGFFIGSKVGGKGVLTGQFKLILDKTE